MINNPKNRNQGEGVGVVCAREGMLGGYSGGERKCLCRAVGSALILHKQHHSIYDREMVAHESMMKAVLSKKNISHHTIPFATFIRLLGKIALSARPSRDPSGQVDT